MSLSKLCLLFVDFAQNAGARRFHLISGAQDVDAHCKGTRPCNRLIGQLSPVPHGISIPQFRTETEGMTNLFLVNNAANADDLDKMYDGGRTMLIRTTTTLRHTIYP